MLKNNRPPHIIGTLFGDINQEPAARIKYGYFFSCLSQKVNLIDIHDAKLNGMARWLNAIRSFHPNRARWQDRFYKNVPAFRKRSQKMAYYLQPFYEKADLVLQLGTLFDSSWNKAFIPNIIYTDYTAILSAKKPKAGRSPFSSRQLQEWVALERQAYHNAKHIFCRSELVRISLMEDYNISAKKMVVVGGGVNFETLPQLSDQNSIKKPTALFIGKNFYRKGGDLLLKAFSLSREKFPEARLILLTGDNVPTDLPQDGVEIISPTSSRAAISDLYRRANIFVMPSRLETWGDVFLEAMAYGLPCIGTNEDAMPEIIADQQTGLIVPGESIDGIEDALNIMFGNIALRRQMGLTGRKRIEENFTWERVVEKMLPAIRKVVG